MKTLLFTLLTFFSVNSFSQTTHTFTIDNTDMWNSYDSVVQVGDVINFENGYASTTFYAQLNGTVQPGYPMTVYLNDLIYSYTVPNLIPFVIKVGYSPNNYEEVSFTVSGYAGVDENTLTYTVYPNPTTDFLKVEGTNVETIEIFDVTGKMMITSNSNSIDVSGLKTGSYFAVINKKNQIQFIK